MTRHIRSTPLLIATSVCLFSLLLYQKKPGLFEGANLMLEDVKYRVRGSLQTGKQLALIVIDNDSIEREGEWPWRRDRIAELVKRLKGAGAAVIGLDVLFSRESREAPESDHLLAEAIEDAGNVVLPSQFYLSPAEAGFQSQKEFESELDLIAGSQYNFVMNLAGRPSGIDCPVAYGIEVNSAPFSNAAKQIGFYNVLPDMDGSIRNVPFVIRVQETPYQSFAVAVLKEYLNARSTTLILNGSVVEGIRAGEFHIFTDNRGFVSLNYYGWGDVFETYSVADFLNGEMEVPDLTGKIVLVGGYSASHFEARKSPIGTETFSVEIQATAIDNVIHNRYLRKDYRAILVNIGSVVFFSILLSGVLFNLRGVLGTVIAGCLCILGFLTFDLSLFSFFCTQLDGIYPLTAIVLACSLSSARIIIRQEKRSQSLRRAIREVGETLKNGLDLDIISGRILDSIMRYSGAQRALLLLYEDITPDRGGSKTGRMTAVARRNITDSILESESFINIKNVISAVERSGCAVIIPRTGRKRRVSFAPGESCDIPASAFCVPLIYEGKTLGFIYCDSPSEEAAFAWERELLETFGSQAANVIENAHLQNALKEREDSLRRENLFLREEFAGAKGFGRIIGESRAMQDVFKLIEKAAASDIAVLIEGETGTGKELVAKMIHFTGERREGMFVAQNCAALPETLLESELFGHRRGSFTGAISDKKGLLEIADGGTIFLDEICEMHPDAQAKLLGALQDGIIRPIGESRSTSVDVRIISATNRDLVEEVKNGRFREDLYYRLSAFPIKMPPLRERRDDIPMLASHFLEVYSKKLGKRLMGFSKEAMDLLSAHDFPGNIRELENEVERAVAIAVEDGMITTDMLSQKLKGIRPVELEEIPLGEGYKLKDMIQIAEREFLKRVLKHYKGNMEEIAKRIGISRRSLFYKIKQYNLE